MPNKITEVTDALKAAQKAAGEIFSGNPGVYATQHSMSVSLDSLRDLEQVPGEVEYEDRGRDEWPWKAWKMYGGAEFYVLLTQEEYEAARLT